ncbi:MAG: glycerol-3-phosphate dehydrogenase/oxidase [Arenicella sp.]|nr:glycerol-3-phosphate dehydrogenase/oxidase [Arenicella sp.]
MIYSNLSGSKRDLGDIAEQTFDVVIVGGGITGAWLSLHCVQQGYKTALIEKADYASQTSAASSKLLHGGIRYLQQMQFDKVRESAMERAEFIYAAPHLSNAVPFVVPTYPDFKRSKFFLSCGMLAYQALCLGQNSVIDSKEQGLGGIDSINADQLNKICDLDNEPHTGAVVFNERHMIDSERMVLAIIQTARELGAKIHNYVAATDFLGDDNTVLGVVARDQLSGNQFAINSGLVINAAGPWIDDLNSKLKNADKAPRINSFAIGSHIVTRQICDHAIALTTKHQAGSKIDRGGRHVFAIPWRGYSLIGTSHNEIDSADGDISLQAEHVEQLIEAINDAMPAAKLTRDDVVSGYSGLYDFRTNNIKSTVYQGSGEYQIIDHQSANKVAGLVTALGAKYTTGRKVSAMTMKVVNAKLSIDEPASDKKIVKQKLRGSDYASLAQLQRAKLDQYKDQYTAETIKHLLMSYGSDIDAFLLSINDKCELQKNICATQPDLFGQVVWAIEEEQAVTLNDVVFGRTSLGLLGLQSDELSGIAKVMAEKLDWSSDELERQLNATSARMNKTQAAIDG